MTRVGLLISQHDITVADALDSARAADTAGIDVWVAGQLLALSNHREKPTLEPLSMLAAIATVTTRSRLGCMVYPAPYLPPFILAKTLITLDHLADGRLEIGLGAGWLEEEFRALGSPMPTAGSRRADLNRTIDAITTLADGGAWDAGAGHLARSGPAAVQRPNPPLWIAGQTPRILELIGRRADWSNFARGISVEDFTAAAAIIRDASVAAGRPADAVRLSLTGAFMGGLDDAAFGAMLEARAVGRTGAADAYREQLRNANAFVGPPTDIADQLRPYVDAGCEAFILWSLERHDPAVADVLAAVQDILKS